MSRQVRLRIRAHFDSAGGEQEGTIIIDRDAGLLHCRPLRSHRVYTMPLRMVADMICKRIIINETHDERRAKKAARRKRAA